MFFPITYKPKKALMNIKRDHKIFTETRSVRNIRGSPKTDEFLINLLAAFLTLSNLLEPGTLITISFYSLITFSIKKSNLETMYPLLSDKCLDMCEFSIFQTKCLIMSEKL